MMYKVLFAVFIVLAVSTQYSCHESTVKYSAFDTRFHYSGRVDSSGAGMTLISSAASVTMYVSGNTCVLLLRNDTRGNSHNYFSIEQNGTDLGRFRIDGDQIIEWEISLPRDKEMHRLTLFKATEPGVGNIEFHGLKCAALHVIEGTDRIKIEFIGNSITCGMSADAFDIPCDRGVWYDQHNAYCTYASRIAHALDAEYMLSAASGCGIYRHWNRDHPNLPEIYDQTYLDFDTTRRWDFSSWTSDIVSICLGTNDLSDGDGITPRAPFDAERFTAEYIKFVQTIYRHYPKVQLVLLSSPMLNGEKAELLAICLQAVKTYFDSIPLQPPIRLFYFKIFTPNGCGYHPDCTDHERMAEELLPLFQELRSEWE